MNRVQYSNLYCEEWDRKKNYEAFNGGFLNFPKTIEAWSNEKNKHLQQNADKLNSEERLIEHNVVSDTTIHEKSTNQIVNWTPWQTSSGYDFPADYDNLSFYISGLLINNKTLETLIPDKELDDNVINSFLQVCQHANDTRDPLIFYLFFFSSLLLNNQNSGFFRCAQKVQAWSYRIWLIPIGGNVIGHYWLLYF